MSAQPAAQLGRLQTEAGRLEGAVTPCLSVWPVEQDCLTWTLQNHQSGKSYRIIRTESPSAVLI
jgi:hypothetical protein